ncbi:MAG: hypothetical protein Q9217_004530 [Psora testacea]
METGLIALFEAHLQYKFGVNGESDVMGAPGQGKVITLCPSRNGLCLEWEKELCMKPLALRTVSQPHCSPSGKVSHSKAVRIAIKSHD